MRYAAIEGGGTSWLVAIAENEPNNIIERHRVHTTTPAETLGQIKEWLQSRTFDAIGIASFGPIDANPTSKYFGYITSTPKPGWDHADVLGLLGVRDFGVPFKFDTDVNAPAYAEYVLNDEDKCSSCAYITVGTGIGVGLVINGGTVTGLMHPEAGHIQTARKPGDVFPGACPYHGGCVEGMSASGALAARRQCTAEELASLPDEDPVWDDCAFYLAQLCATVTMVASPERIVFGGGIMNRASLYPKIRVSTQLSISCYHF
jgi:fructokinase